MIFIMGNATPHAFLHTQKFFFNIKNTVIVVKISQTTTTLNSCGNKNTQGSDINHYDQICA